MTKTDNDRQPASAQPFIRIAELRVEPTRAADFIAAAPQLAACARQTEPGCLALFSAADTEVAGRFTVLEIYRDEAAYQAHLATPHFMAFRAATNDFVLSRRLRTASAFTLMLRPDWLADLGADRQASG